jgi:mono/diheme cytochrome c family protein
MRNLSGNWAVLAALLVLGSACGDDDDGGATGTGGTGASGGSGGTSNTDLVARGEYLVNHVAVCVDCHTPRTGTPPTLDMTRLLSGTECFFDVNGPGEAGGCLHTRNLTNHETGLKNFSDTQIKAMFLNGQRPDRALHPIMPYWSFGNMTVQDADAIVAYLRTVAGVDHEVPASDPPFTPPESPAPRLDLSKVPEPSSTDPNFEAAKRGRDLAAQAGVCLECHTKEPLPATGSPRDLNLVFQGGGAFPAAALGLPSPPFPETIYSANLTPHANGIQGWTVDQLVQAIMQGVDRDGKPNCPPMPVFSGLTDGDARDIAYYLLSLPAGDNLVERCTPPG